MKSRQACAGRWERGNLWAGKRCSEQEEKDRLPIDWLLWTAGTQQRGRGRTEILTARSIFQLWWRYTRKNSKRELFSGYFTQEEASLVVQMVKNLPVMRETRVQSLGREDPLEKEMATHYNILAWRVPWTEEPGGLYSPWESDTTEQLILSLHKSRRRRKQETTPLCRYTNMTFWSERIVAMVEIWLSEKNVYEM